MKYRNLGKTGLKVSELGLGTAQLAGPSMIAGKPSGFGEIPVEESRAILRQAFGCGINFVDTGDIYGDGRAETLIGEIEKDYPGVIIATKCGLTKDGTRDFSPGYITSALEGSLKRLRRKFVDVFQLTKPPLEAIREGAIFDTLDRLKAEGKIRFCGVSIATPEEGFELIGKVDTLQVLYNILDRSAEALIEKAAASGTGVIVRSPLSTGLLTGKITPDTKFEDYDYRKAFFTRSELEKRWKQIEEVMKERSIGTGKLREAAFRFLLENKNVSTIIAGCSRLDQLIQNIEVVDSI